MWPRATRPRGFRSSLLFEGFSRHFQALARQHHFPFRTTKPARAGRPRPHELCRVLVFSLGAEEVLVPSLSAPLPERQSNPVHHLLHMASVEASRDREGSCPRLLPAGRWEDVFTPRGSRHARSRSSDLHAAGGRGWLDLNPGNHSDHQERICPPNQRSFNANWARLAG